MPKKSPSTRGPAPDSRRDTVGTFFRNRFPEFPELGEGFAAHCEFLECPKGGLIKKSGEPEGWFSLLLDGSAGVFVGRAKREVCLDLSLPGDFLADWESFVTGRPSEAEVRALEPVLLARITLPGPGCSSPPGMEQLLLAASRHMFLDRQNRLVSMLTEAPRARYLQLERRNPALVRRISTTVLATWLEHPVNPARPLASGPGTAWTSIKPRDHVEPASSFFLKR